MRRDGAWWVVPVMLACYLGAIALIAVQWGVWAGVAAWLLPPAAFGGIVVLWADIAALWTAAFGARNEPIVDGDEVYRRLNAAGVVSINEAQEARERHPAGRGKPGERPCK